MRILSVQSWVADGRVGNAAVLFPLQRLGADVAAIHTVQFSNHPGHGHFTGRVFPAGDTAALVAGLAAHGTLARCDALLSGYTGDAETGAVIADAAAQMRAANPAALWCCDPVMGDDGRLYVSPGLPVFFRAALGAMDIVTPNAFELEQLTGLACTDVPGAAAAARALRARLRQAGPQIVLVSSLGAPPDGVMRLVLAAPEGRFVLETPFLPAKFSGAGDLLSALFLFHVLAGSGAQNAAVRAVGSLAGVLRQTLADGAPELALVRAQAELLQPSTLPAIYRCDP